MKKLLPFTFILFAQLSFSQNWAPINLTSKFNYQVDTANYITNTIWVDSVDVVGGDSVFYLNRIVKVSPTCDGSFPNPECFIWKNQPQFLQRKIVKQSNGNYHFVDSLSFVLDVNAQLGVPWLFDTLNNITATITNLSEENVFGNLDSVKTITLNPGGYLKLSKSHGFLYFSDQSYLGVDYQLVGMENPDLGEVVPGFWEIFDFEVGVNFCKKFIDGTGGGNGGYEIFKTRGKITQKEVHTNLYIYYTTAKRVHEYIYWGQSTIFSVNNWNETYHYEDTLEAKFNGYNHQLFEIELRFAWTPHSVYHYCTLEKLNDGRYRKVIGDRPVFIQSDSIPDLLISRDGFDPYSSPSSQWIYEEGRGQVLQDYSTNFEGGFTTTFDYIDDTLAGPNYCFPFNVSVGEIEHDVFSISPNPATDRVTLTLPQPLKGDIIIYNQTGQVVYNQGMSSSMKQEVNVSHLPAGLYLLNVRGENFSSFEKLVITR